MTGTKKVCLGQRRDVCDKEGTSGTKKGHLGQSRDVWGKAGMSGTKKMSGVKKGRL